MTLMVIVIVLLSEAEAVTHIIDGEPVIIRCRRAAMKKAMDVPCSQALPVA